MDNNPDLDSKSEGDDERGGEGGGEMGVKRRRRGDAGERNYTCGCGKSYLSYPALYTHIKTKHNGVTPAGTSQPQTNGKSGRGRPKKEDSVNKIKEEDKGEHFDSHDAQVANETMIGYLRTLGEKVHYNSQAPGTNGVVSDNLDTFDLIQKFPTSILRHEDYGPVFNELSAIYANKNIGSEELDRETGLKKTNMNKIFAIFIYCISRQLREEFYKEFIFFLMMYRKCLNEIGWIIKAEVTGVVVSENEKKIEFCVINNGEYAPDVCNDFITDKWAEYLPSYNINDFKVVGQDTEMTKNAVFLTQHFCNWLNAQRYTNSRLQINDENE